MCVLVLGMQPPLPTAAVRELVCSCLHRDPVAADLRCSLFVAAVQSYKRDSALRPFPPRYLRGEIKDFEELVRHLKKINSLCCWPFETHILTILILLCSSQQKDVDTLPNVRDLVRLGHGDGDHHLALVHWALSSKSFAVKTLQKEEVLLNFISICVVCIWIWVLLMILLKSSSNTKKSRKGKKKAMQFYLMLSLML